MTDDARGLAIELFNHAWTLIDRTDRTPDDDLDMVLAAAASRWHWGQVGGAEQRATGDWQVAHAASQAGLADLALRFAARGLAIAEAEGWTGWRVATHHESMARACAAAGDWDGRDHHVGLAETALEGEADADDRNVIADQLASVPRRPV